MNFKSQYPAISIAWKKYQNKEISKREWLHFIKTLCKKCGFKVGENKVRYLQRRKGSIDRTGEEESSTKDVVWTDGEYYDFIFIRLERATLEDIEYLMSKI